MIPLVCKLLDAGKRKARRAVFYVAAKAVELYGDLGYGEMPLAANDTKLLSEFATILHGNQGAVNACEVQHAVKSGPKGTPNQEAFPVLKLAARDWINEYAPGRKWVAALQDHNGSPHLHLLVENVGADGKALKIRPHQVKAMAAMAFTEHAISAKGIGKKGLSFYSKADSLDVSDLARELAPAVVAGEDLAALVKGHAKCTDLRLRKNGEVISFALGDQRIRLKTLQFYLDELADSAAPAPVVPVAPPSLPAAPPPPQPESPLDQFVRIGQRVRPAQNQTKPGVNAPGNNLK